MICSRKCPANVPTQFFSRLADAPAIFFSQDNAMFGRLMSGSTIIRVGAADEGQFIKSALLYVYKPREKFDKVSVHYDPDRDINFY